MRSIVDDDVRPYLFEAFEHLCLREIADADLDALLGVGAALFLDIDAVNFRLREILLPHALAGALTNAKLQKAQGLVLPIAQKELILRQIIVAIAALIRELCRADALKLLKSMEEARLQPLPLTDAPLQAQAERRRLGRLLLAPLFELYREQKRRIRAHAVKRGKAWKEALDIL